MSFPEAPATWEDVAFAVASARRDGYLLGDRHGYERGWHQGVEAGIRHASADDLEFAQLVEQQFHHRELQGERNRDLVRRLLSAAQTAENRRKWAEQFERRSAA